MEELCSNFDDALFEETTKKPRKPVQPYEAKQYDSLVSLEVIYWPGGVMGALTPLTPASLV